MITSPSGLKHMNTDEENSLRKLVGANENPNFVAQIQEESNILAQRLQLASFIQNTHSLTSLTEVDNLQGVPPTEGDGETKVTP